jgi:hypothetical protein
MRQRLILLAAFLICANQPAPAQCQGFEVPLSSAERYLQSVSDPRPGSDVPMNQRDPDSWEQILTGCSKIGYCRGEQAGGSAPARRLAAQNALRTYLSGDGVHIVKDLTAHQVDAMLDFIQHYCEAESSRCDCTEILENAAGL